MSENKDFVFKETDRAGTTWSYDENEAPHRLGGPAIEGKNGFKAYCKHGHLHNLEGPARIWENGREEYWIKGVKYPSLKEWEKKVTQIKKDQENNPSIPPSESVKTDPVTTGSE